MTKSERRMFPPVLTKRDFVRRYKAGEFGNAAPTWESLEDWEPKPGALYNIRNRVIGAKTWYNVPTERVAIVWKEACLLYGKVNLYISEMAPHHEQRIQGEVQRSERHLELQYSTVKRPMREALAIENLHAEGIIAVYLLKENLCPNSWAWLNVLLDRYENHIVEFTSFNVLWGTLPHFNTVYWEVRCY